MISTKENIGGTASHAITELEPLCATRESELYSAVENSPELFKKPRTFVMHGCKVGYTVSTGKVEYEDEAHTVKLIERHFKERFDDLVKTEKTPRKDALKALTPAELARVGCRIDGAGDVVLVKRESGDMDKLIKKLIEKLVEAMVSGE
jgi:hypothetical protein